MEGREVEGREVEGRDDMGAWLKLPVILGLLQSWAMWMRGLIVLSMCGNMIDSLSRNKETCWERTK